MAPSTVEIDDMKKLFGNEQLSVIVTKAAELQQSIGDWTKAKELSEQRKPVWNVVERLARHAAPITSAAEQIKQVDAIRDNRMLLDSIDHVSPLRSDLAGLLRAAINEAHFAHEKAYEAGIEALDSNSMWNGIPETERNGILVQVGLGAPDIPAAVKALRQRGIMFVDRGAVQPSEKGALTQPYLGGVTFELVHSQLKP